MPKVLRIVNRFNIGGPMWNVAYLSKDLSPEYETLLIGGPCDSSEESSLGLMHSMGLKPLIIPEMRRSINPIDDYVAYRKIRKIIRTYRPDIVHTHASKAGFLGRLAAFHEKVPKVYHTFHGHVFHGYFGKIFSFILKLVERYLATKSTKIIAISSLQQQELADVFKIAPMQKIELIPLGFDLNRFTQDKEIKRKNFRSKYGIPEDVILVGTVGRMEPIKNHKMFVRIVHDLQKNNPDKYIGMIVGDGSCLKDIQAYISSLGMSQVYRAFEQADVILTSWIQEIDEVYAGMDVVLMTSLNEGTPVSLIEAQASGTYVLSTDVGGVKDVVLNTQTGRVVASFDPEVWAKELTKLQFPEKKSEFQHQINSLFGVAPLIEKTKRLYRQDSLN